MCLGLLSVHGVGLRGDDYFVGIGGNVDHQASCFLFINKQNRNSLHRCRYYVDYVIFVIHLNAFSVLKYCRVHMIYDYICNQCLSPLKL